MGCNQYNIREFLEKFWEGNSSLEEENAIREYFQYNEVPDDLKEAAAYFSWIDNQKVENQLDDSFDEEIMSKINGNYSSGGRVVSMPMKWLSMAASIALIFGLAWWGYVNTKDNQPIAGESNINKELNEAEKVEVKNAFGITKNALFMVSSKLNKGTDQVNKIKKFNEAEESIQKKTDDSDQKQLEQ